MNEERVRETIREEFDRKKDDIRFDMKRMTIKELILGIIGVAILSVRLLLSSITENVGVEVLSLMGGVCIWEASCIILMERQGKTRPLRFFRITEGGSPFFRVEKSERIW